MKGFQLIKPEDYARLQAGDFIKYEGTDGIQYTKSLESGTHWLLKPASGQGSAFPVYLDKVAAVWKRVPIEHEQLVNAVSDKQDYISDICHWLWQVDGASFLEFMKERERERERQRRREQAN